METLVYLSFFVIGWVVGRELLIRKVSKCIASGMLDTRASLSKLEQKIPVCTIEQEKNEFYLYDNYTKEFYCQAPNIDQLAINLSKNTSIQTALVLQSTDTDLYVWVFKDGKSLPGASSEETVNES